MKKILFAGSMLCVIMLFGAVSVPAQGTSSGGDQFNQFKPEATPSAPPAGHKVRYTLPYYMSQNSLAGSRSVTIINVMNQSAKDCNVGVQFQYGSGVTDICDITIDIPAGQSRILCSRPVNDPLADCQVYCPSGGLIFNSGHAFISSNSVCTKIAVDALMAFTSDVDDNVVTGITPLTIVKYNKVNVGD